MKYKKSLMINIFEEFYTLLLKYKQQVDNEIFFDINDSEEEKNKKIENVQNRLYLFIKDKDAKIAYENGKIASIQFQEVIYIMCALADELFLELDWEGKAYWRTHLLERKFFNTNQAGEKLLMNLDAFLKERNVSDNEVGLIYLYALALGFKGRLRFEEDMAFYLKTLKDNLFSTIYRHAPHFFRKQENVLFKQALQTVFADKIANKDMRIAKWTRIALACVGIYLITSAVVWNIHTNSVWLMIANVYKIKRGEQAL